MRFHTITRCLAGVVFLAGIGSQASGAPIIIDTFATSQSASDIVPGLPVSGPDILPVDIVPGFRSIVIMGDQTSEDFPSGQTVSVSGGTATIFAPEFLDAGFSYTLGPPAPSSPGPFAPVIGGLAFDLTGGGTNDVFAMPTIESDSDFILGVQAVAFSEGGLDVPFVTAGAEIPISAGTTAGIMIPFDALSVFLFGGPALDGPGSLEEITALDVLSSALVVSFYATHPLDPTVEFSGTFEATSAVPLPAPLVLLITALAGLGLLGWRRRATGTT